MSPRHSHRLLIVSMLVLGLLAATGVAAAAIYDHGRQDRLAPGIRIGGVDVGGLSVDSARARVEAHALAPRRRTIRIRGTKMPLALTPAQAHVTADVDTALERAHSDSRRGWLGARVAHDLSGRRVKESIALNVHYARSVVPALVARAEKAVAAAPTDAKVQPAADGLTRLPSHEGRALDAAALQRQVVAALRSPSRPATITAPTRPVAPKVSTQALAAKYPAYIVIDRKAHRLRYYKNLELDRTYEIAVGKSGLETPSGLYDVQWKEVNPPWRVPNSSWAGALAGKTIPPGPQDPIKARWMAFDGGAGIHGIDPSEYNSIGKDASHGCVRMRIPDVIDLYAKSPVGTPVFVA